LSEDELPFADLVITVPSIPKERESPGIEEKHMKISADFGGVSGPAFFSSMIRWLWFARWSSFRKNAGKQKPK